MIGAKTRMLLRLMPRMSNYTAAQSVLLSSSSMNSGLCHRSTICCQLNVAALQGTGSLFVPRRYLASGNTDDYIIHQNQLTETEKKEIESSVKKDFEDWVPYGFCPTDKENDIFRYKMLMFSGLTVGAVIFLYVFLHLPPRNRRDWVSREAYLELERRQRLGLPLVDCNLVPADQIQLPSLEELGDDYDIII